MVEGVLDAGGRLGPVGDGYHDRRRPQDVLPPGLCGLKPVVSEQGVGVQYQVWQWLVLLGPPI
nr:hypothetical protein [Methanocella conradii]